MLVLCVFCVGKNFKFFVPKDCSARIRESSNAIKILTRRGDRVRNRRNAGAGAAVGEPGGQLGGALRSDGALVGGGGDPNPKKKQVSCGVMVPHGTESANRKWPLVEDDNDKEDSKRVSVSAGAFAASGPVHRAGVIVLVAPT